MGNTPNLKNSKAVNQQELQNAKQDMNSNMATGQGMMNNITAGFNSDNASSLNSSTAIDQQEVQKVRQKIKESGSKSFQNTGLQ